MKKKALALLLAAAMAIQPLSVAGAGEFTDGQSVDVEAEAVEEVAEEPVEVFTDDVAEEPVVEEEKVEEGSVAPSETAIQMGDDVWVEFDDVNGIATVSGTGAMWDYLYDGETLDKHKNPFRQWSNVQEIVFKGNITHISDYLNPTSYLNSVVFPESLTSIGKSAFSYCDGLTQINLPKNLTQIKTDAFSYCDGLTEINLPDNLTSIDVRAFYQCQNLAQVNLPNGLTSIGDAAFARCHNLSQINLPEGLTSIGEGAFYECVKLSRVDFPESLTSIGNEAFSYCYQLDNLCIPKGVSSLGKYEFSRCENLSTVTLQEGLESLTFGAFSGCIRLQEITIPQSVKMISGDVAESCENLKKIKGYTCSGAKKYYDSLPEEQKQRITFESIGQGTHQWSTEKITIKEPTCEVPGEKAFKCNICGAFSDNKTIIPALGHNWSNWSTIKNPTETEEGEKQRTCWRCDKVETTKIPKLSPIRFEYENVFWRNYDKLSLSAKVNKPVYFYVESKKANEPEPKFDESKLDKTVALTKNVWKEIVVPEDPVTVYLFVQDAEGNNTYIILNPDYYDRPEKPATTIKVGDNITATIEGDTLTLTGSGSTYDWGEDDLPWYEGNQDEIKKVVFNGNITRIGDFFFREFREINKIKFPEGVTELGENVFAYCEGIEELEFPSTLKKIPSFKDEMYGNSVFSNLKAVIISEGILEIGYRVFDGCRQLKNVHLPSTIEKIGDRAFANCSSLEQIELPENLISIGNEVFEGCTSLEVINLPEKLEQMGYNVFANCSMLNELIFPSNLKTIPSIGGCGIKKVTIPEGVVELGYGAFSRCNNLLAIQLPSTIEKIGEEAFELTGITSITWPEKVTMIPDGVFLGSAIKEFTVPNTVEEISSNAFTSCYNLTKITIPRSVKYIGEAAFLNSRNVTIYGDRDSVAERYAYINNIPFVSDCFKVIFKEDGRTKETEYVKEGEDATPPTLSPRPGYTLSWDADYTNITEDMVINAVWTKDGADKPEPPIIVYPPSETKYTVTFKDRGKVIKTEKVVSGEAADFPYVSRYGYELSWDKDFSKVTSNMTVNAVWTVIKPVKVTSMTAEVLPKYVRLSWDETEFTSYYLVYRKAAADKEFKQVAKTTRVLWNDKKVKPGNEYQYKVAAVRSVEGKKYQGEYSDTVTAKIGKPETGDIYSVCYSAN